MCGKGPGGLAMLGAVRTALVLLQTIQWCLMKVLVENPPTASAAMMDGRPDA